MAITTSWFLIGAGSITLPFVASSIAILVSYHLFSIIFKLNKKVWEYASTGELYIILKVVSCTMLVGVIFQLIIIQEIHIRFLVVTMILHILFIGASRFMWRIYRDSMMNKQTNKLRTLIIGAGSAGTMVARQLLHNNERTLLPVGFIDDDEKKHHLDILGVPVIGGVKDIARTVQALAIDHIIIAIPSLHNKDLNIIFQECIKTKVKTKILPLLEDLITGKVSVNAFRDVKVEDLLVRDPIETDIESIAEYITGKVVLVTGAGGSIGSEVVRQVSMFHPRQLILLGHGENSVYTIEMELREKFKNSVIQFITEIADIQDAQKMMSVMGTYKPDVVYHAAAHKHVPLMERHPEEAIKNNIIGTMNIANAANRQNVDTFVMVSTDKAVNPTSVMGATKKLAETVVQNMALHSRTKFVTVRFGNVLGSAGSVIPLFKKQIEQGGPITITHPDMVRYFMTIPEASKLVIQAGALANGGEIFVLDMGDPVKIVDLAKNLIHLSGYSMDEIDLEFTGIRPGEKLFEELLDDNEILPGQLYPEIYIGKTTELYWGDIEKLISTFTSMDKDSLRDHLLHLANNHEVIQPEAVLSLQN
jgi:FlaA1/EpsC-like NDP-sugar epimerase